MTENNEETLDQLVGPAQAMESWGITGTIGYDEDGTLLLSGSLGLSVVSENFDHFIEALSTGKSDAGLTYQDMADFNQFSQEFRIEGIRPSRYPFHEHLVVVRKSDGAPYGFEVPEHDTEPSWEDDERGFIWDFVPMNPVTIQGYEPA